MKSMLLLLLIAAAIASPAPSHLLPVHPGVGGFYRGPNSETIIKGPDGSVITAAAVGGEVQTHLEPIVVAEPAVVQEVVATVTPVVETGRPLVHTVEINAPIIEPKQSSELVGPSGVIATHGSHSIVAGPASTTITGPVVVGETVIKGAPIVAPSVPISVSVPVSLPSPAVVDSVAVSSAPQASASASSSPHYSVATASSSSSAVATATAGPNVASASIKTLPVHTVVSTPAPFIPSSVILPNSHGISINGHVDLAATNQIRIPSYTLAPPLVGQVKTISAVTPLPHFVSSTPAPVVAVSPTLATVPAVSTLASNHVTPIIAALPTVQRVETDVSPIRHVPLSESEQIVLAQQQALLRNEIKSSPEVVHVTPIPHAIGTFAAAEQQAILNGELAKHGVEPLKWHLSSVPWSDVAEVAPDWARYGRDTKKNGEQEDGAKADE